MELLRGFLRRPAAASVLSLIGVVAFYVIFGGVDLVNLVAAASWMNLAANLGIVAIPMGLLMIAGQMDISIGAMIPAGSITTAILSGYYGLPIEVGMLAALGLGVLVGVVNGILTVRTTVPSLIITLGTLIGMQGIVLSAAMLLVGKASVSLKAPDWAKSVFGQLLGGTHQIIILWWIAFTLVIAFVLHMTRFGNWIFASGGDAESARNSGVPVNRVKILMFMKEVETAPILDAMAKPAEADAKRVAGISEQLRLAFTESRLNKRPTP